MLEWDEPCPNNSKIEAYSIYVNEILFESQIAECYFEIHKLNFDTCYKIQIIAESDRGEGYKTKQPHIFKTLKFSEKCSVYVWGQNANSEIGLTNELV